MITGINIFNSKEFFLFIENIFFVVLYAIFGTLLLAHYYSDTFNIYINGNGGFVGNYLKQTFIGSLLISNEKIFYYILLLVTSILFLIASTLSAAEPEVELWAGVLSIKTSLM